MRTFCMQAEQSGTTVAVACHAEVMFTVATGECDVFADAVQLSAISMQSPSCHQCGQVLKCKHCWEKSHVQSHQIRCYARE